VGKKGERTGASWQNCHPLPPIGSEQREGDWGGPPAGSGDCRRPGTGGKGRGGRGLSTPRLTLVGDGLRRGV
jgi:hypothetical protein